MPNRFYRSIKGTSLQVKVDLITGEFPDLATTGTHLPIQELAVWKARGVDLAFAFQQEISVEGVLPDGGHNKVTARMPMIAAYLCIKAITLSERKGNERQADSAILDISLHWMHERPSIQTLQKHGFFEASWDGAGLPAAALGATPAPACA